MNCCSCNKEIPDGSTFCKYCGTTQPAASASTAQPAAAAPAAQPVGATPTPQAYGTPIGAPGPDNFRKTGAMFSNIGDKLCGFAKVLCWIGIICSILLGFAIIVSGCAAGSSMGNNGASASAAMFFVGILTMGIGSLMSWLSSLALYGFGELIRRT